WCLDSLREMIHMAQKRGVKVFVCQHLERDELISGQMLPGHDEIMRAAEAEGVKVIQFGPLFKSVIDNAHLEPYRDFIHPNPLGQKLMAEMMFSEITEDIEGKTDH